MEKVQAKSIVYRTKDSGWFGADYNMKIYKGCCHGCIYCDSRSECYGIGQFDNVAVKDNALEIIRDDLRRKVKKGIVATGAMSDPYNPYEKDLKLTRNALELISAFGFGAAIATKSDLVTRDIDILCDIKENMPVIIKLTITTTDDKLASKIEPNVSRPAERLKVMRKLSQNGIFTGALLMPVLPFITDNAENIVSVVRGVKEHGGRFVYPAMGMTLRQNQRTYYYDCLDREFNGLKERYIMEYGNRYECASPKARKLYSVFKEECERLGILYKMQDIIKACKLGYESKQLSLFDWE